MTTKDPFRKQVLVPITMVNSNRIMVLSNKHVVNINKVLKDIKLDVMANFIRANHRGLMIITNKVTSTSNFNTIEKYIKNVDVVDSNDISSSRLPQSKSYLKILDIPDLIKDTDISITSNIIKRVIQSTHIFDNMVLSSKLRIIKASSKSNIAVIWVNI